MPKATVIADIRYHKRGRQNATQMVNLLKYLQYRDGSVRREEYLKGLVQTEKDQVPPGAHRDAKWVDQGMGEGYGQIAKNAREWQGKKVLARTWVISPDPDLMKHIPEDQRLEVMQRLTEGTVKQWFKDNGWGIAQYSYVIHDKQRIPPWEEKLSPDATPKQRARHIQAQLEKPDDWNPQMLHSHIITPGTLQKFNEPARIDHWVKKAHMIDLQRTTQKVFEAEMERVLGRERAQEIVAERNHKVSQKLAQTKGLKKEDQARHSELMHKLTQAHDALRLLGQLTSKSPKKEMRAGEARMYARFLRDGKMQAEERRRADERRRYAARKARWERQRQILEQHQEKELARERAEQRARMPPPPDWDAEETPDQEVDLLEYYEQKSREEAARQRSQGLERDPDPKGTGEGASDGARRLDELK